MTEDFEIIYDETYTIEDGDVYILDIEEGDSDEVVIILEVVDGPKVDVDLTDARGYQRYMDGYEYSTFNIAPQTSVEKATLRFEPDNISYHLITECNGSPGIRPIVGKESSTVHFAIGIK